MRGKKVKSGDIIQIPLPKYGGFTYAQYIDLIKLNSQSKYPSLMIFFNIVSMKPLSSKELLLDSLDLILCPHLVGGVQPVINRGEWTIVDNNLISDKKYSVPEYKFSSPSSMIEDDVTAQWFCVSNCDILTKRLVAYSQVRHLETLGAVGAALISTKLAMAFIKEKGANIKDYFELEDFYEKVFYWQVLNIPAYYKQSKEMQGKAILAQP